MKRERSPYRLPHVDDQIRDSRPVRGILVRHPQGDTGNLQEQGIERSRYNAIYQATRWYQL